jgi:putative thymidine phosphorylase
MELKIRILNWTAGIPSAMLNQKTAKRLGIQTKDRISIKTFGKKSKEISTTLDTIKGIIRENELGVSSEVKKILDLRKGQKVDVNFSMPPKSLDFIKEKLNGKRLSRKKIDSIIEDIVNNSLSESEIALFISGTFKVGMTMKETINLTKAIYNSGSHLNLKNKYIAEKHCIGGVPGNRTTPIVISICAATGLIMPKTSSKAITSAAGTADTMATIARVEFNIKEVKKILKKTNACIVWGGSLGILPADSKIIKVEKMLKIDPRSQLLASIISKKLSMGTKYILIDIPYGKGSKFSKKKALLLKKDFDIIGKYFHKKIKCILTDGSQPIGRGIGPGPEMEDIIDILDPEKKGPKDLEEKSIFLAGELLELAGKAKKNQGNIMAEKILYDGQAFKKFKEIVEAQEGDLGKLKKPKFEKNILSRRSMKIKSLENKKISSLARITGCPLDKSSGLDLWVKKGDQVKKGQKLITIYANSKNRLNEAVKFFRDEKPIR